MQRGILVLCAFILVTTACHADDKPAYEPIENYGERKIEGWTVLVNKKLDDKSNEALRDDTLKLLGDHLYRITLIVPEKPLARLRKIPIWVELAHPKHPCMCYHPSPDWLKANAMNPKKAGAVELANCKNFLSWTKQQPWMVLHELAHGFHHQVLGFDHAEVKMCFDEAMRAKSYDSVLHINGSKRKHYAATNPQEYFAEATEAFFGTNDFFPFVRAELKQHDARFFELLEKLWETQPKK